MTRTERDRGEVTASTVLLIPVVVLLLMLGIQAAIWAHAAHVATASAANGAAVGATRGSGPVTAAAAALAMLADLDGEPVRAPSVVVDARTVRVTVAVAVPRLVPFFPTTVTRTALEPREEFRPEPTR
jgi:hypothetical protein